MTIIDFDGAGNASVQGVPETFPISVEDANRVGYQYYLVGDLARAERQFVSVVQADPLHAAGWSNLGLIWQTAGFEDDALKCYLRSLDLKPDSPGTLTNLGFLYDVKGHSDHAIRFYRRALEIDPQYPTATCNLGYALLRRFQFAEGWPMLEARFRMEPRASLMRNYTIPEWKGEECKRLFLWQEQGIGDTILYATLLPELIGRGQAFVLEVDERLIPAFERTYPGCAFVKPGEEIPPDCDMHAPIMSLAWRFRDTIESFAAQPEVALHANRLRGRELRDAMSEGREQRVAISWSSPNHPSIKVAKMRQKSASLAVFEPLGQREDLRLVNVQYGNASEELALWKGRPICSPPIDNFMDIDGVLAVIDGCDAVVTTSNVTAHFAGALGKHTYLVVKGLAPFFYWEPAENGNSLWYPSVSIIQADSWEKCIAAVNERI